MARSSTRSVRLDSSSKKSLAARMRAVSRAGIDGKPVSVGEIGRMFGVNYHQAYQAVVVNKNALDRDTYESSLAHRKDLPFDDRVKLLTDDELKTFEATPSPANASKTKRQELARQRTVARDELDRRYPDGSWMDVLVGSSASDGVSSVDPGASEEATA